MTSAQVVFFRVSLFSSLKKKTLYVILWTRRRDPNRVVLPVTTKIESFSFFSFRCASTEYAPRERRDASRVLRVQARVWPQRGCTHSPAGVPAQRMEETNILPTTYLVRA